MKYSSRMIKSCAYFGIVAMFAIFAVLNQQPQAIAAPLAGTVIGNQASATYTDASNAGRTATSNTVNTIVQQVPAFTLVTSQTKTVSPGGTVYFGHTITNTGNGADTFFLHVADLNNGSFTFAGVNVYLDANGDGLPDSFTSLQDTYTTSIPAGGQFKFVVSGTVPGSALNGNTDQVKITATSSTNQALINNNTDTVNVTSAAVVALTKSESIASGPPGTTIKYTLTYTNTGNATATNVAIEDTLNANLAYVRGTARWSVTGTTALTDLYGDAAQGAGPTMDYYTYATTKNDGGTGKIWANISAVGPGQSGTLTFDVIVNAGIPPQIIPNTGAISYADGVNTTRATGTSNQVSFTVTQSAGVLLDDNPSPTDKDGVKNDIISEGSVTQGGTIAFGNVVHNTGNGTDTFNIVIDNYTSTFPAGTSFLLYKSDGVSPLVDTNGDNIVDTGPMVAGASYNVYVQVTLPAGASGNNGGAGYDVYSRAISVLNAAVADPTRDHLGTITPNTVDMTNNVSFAAATAADGKGIYTSKTASLAAGRITNPTLNPGDTYTFALYVNNTSTVPDSFDLLGDINTTAAFGAASTVPAGWTLTFRANATGVCATTGATLSNTGTINAGANKLVCAVVTIPATQAPGTVDIYFRAKSPTSNALDIKTDAVTIRTVRSLQITTNNAGQVFPGGSVVYTHTITNVGNVAEGTVATGSETAATSSVIIDGYTNAQNSLSGNGWTSVVYWDKDNSGTLNATDPVVTDLFSLSGGTNGASVAAGLDVAESATLFVKVFAPLGAAVNDINTTTITATAATAINAVAAPAAVSNQDNTTVIAGQVRLVKTQALDALCDGYADTAFSTADLQGNPGQCIRYQVVATNAGTADVTSLVVSDSTPANTTYHAATDAGCTANVGAAPVAASTTVGTVTATPACGAAGTISINVGTLTPTQSATIQFGVRIAP